jgi:hypothetical protein
MDTYLAAISANTYIAPSCLSARRGHRGRRGRRCDVEARHGATGEGKPARRGGAKAQCDDAEPRRSGSTMRVG